MRGSGRMNTVDYLCTYINGGVKSEGYICAPNIIVNSLGQTDYVKSFFGKKICRLVRTVSAEGKYAVELLLFVGSLHLGNLVDVVTLDNLHHLVWCALCAKDCAALRQNTRKILGLHNFTIIVYKTVKTVSYSDYLDIILAEKGIARLRRASYRRIESGTVASAG